MAAPGSLPPSDRDDGFQDGGRSANCHSAPPLALRDAAQTNGRACPELAEGRNLVLRSVRMWVGRKTESLTRVLRSHLHPGADLLAGQVCIRRAVQVILQRPRGFPSRNLGARAESPVLRAGASGTECFLARRCHVRLRTPLFPDGRIQYS
jgi:hypothetical protein